MERSTRFSYRSRCLFQEGEEHSRQRNQDVQRQREVPYAMDCADQRNSSKSMNKNVGS